jgi:hypothetical protein
MFQSNSMNVGNGNGLNYPPPSIKGGQSPQQQHQQGASRGPVTLTREAMKNIKKMAQGKSGKCSE